MVNYHFIFPKQNVSLSQRNLLSSQLRPNSEEGRILSKVGCSFVCSLMQPTVQIVTSRATPPPANQFPPTPNLAPVANARALLRTNTHLTRVHAWGRVSSDGGRDPQLIIPKQSTRALSSLDDASMMEEELVVVEGLSRLRNVALSAAPVLGASLLFALGAHYKDQIADHIEVFAEALKLMGPSGYFAFIAVYVALEMLAVPAIPLTMSVGALFGVGPGLLAASAGATIAAGLAFLVARYLLRDRVQAFAETHGGATFVAVDRALAREGFKVVTLLRLSPLLPLSLSNYIYGLTSVEFAPYLLGSWLGMLPGTYLYVQAGAVGFDLLAVGESTAGTLGGVNSSTLAVVAGLGASALAAGYVGKVAQKAIEDLKKEDLEL
eukprot:CAMPEP_0196583078 /NCGR_PEP_ID=MMETSP1081-20130531/41916_1 /TAXON_ID=36882 /ORGANISM="Pyramimonas amylifera, Strain CCMP720" /LENGTH=378 /DNA_ID=CAMNT_0041903843 /DNA_START=125 /DNA_END=1261 /DNA_ORIENTATION=-